MALETPPNLWLRAPAPLTRATRRVQSGARGLLIAMALGGAVALEGVLLAAIALGQAPPAAPQRFRYDEPSGRCLDSEGRAGYDRGSREELEETGEAECADFSGKGLNMTYLHLARANLQGANFANVSWYLGSITDSDLTGANLSRTSGQMAYRGSRLRNARLSESDLTWSDLRDADLGGADLRDARFSRHTRLPFDHDEALRRGMVFVPRP
jgi:uncharacterized protein YjbI with pentapeptide repeats